MVFVNGRLVTAWSRTLKSIALSSCESEYLASVGGGSEALCIAAACEFRRERERLRLRLRLRLRPGSFQIPHPAGPFLNDKAWDA